MSRAGWSALALLLSVAACADDGSSPSSLITMPRLLAIAADPPVVAIDGAARLRALVVDGEGREVATAVSWRACSPWKAVQDPDVDCGPAVAWPLPIDADGAAVLDVGAAVARFGGAITVPAPGPCAVSAVAVPVIATAVVDGTRLIARKDVWVGGPPRRVPALAAITLDGADATRYVPGQPQALAARPARASLDETCTGDTPPQPVLEAVRMHFYVDAGELSAASAEVTYQPDGSETEGSIVFTGPADRAPVRLWTIAIDGDGGVAWDGRELTAR